MRMFSRFLMASATATMLVMGCGSDKKDSLSESDTATAEDDIRTSSEEAATAAAQSTDSASSVALAATVGTASSPLAVVNRTVQGPSGVGSAVVSFNGTIGGEYTASITFTNWGPSAITGTITLSRSSTGTYALNGSVEWKGNSVDIDYSYTRTNGNVCPKGKIGGRSYDPCASTSTTTGDNPFAKCQTQSTDPCLSLVCAQQSVYSACTQQGASSYQTYCTKIKACVTDVSNCICPNGTLNANGAATCGTNYSTCLSNAASSLQK